MSTVVQRGGRLCLLGGRNALLLGDHALGGGQPLLRQDHRLGGSGRFGALNGGGRFALLRQNGGVRLLVGGKALLLQHVILGRLHLLLGDQHVGAGLFGHCNGVGHLGR